MGRKLSFLQKSTRGQARDHYLKKHVRARVINALYLFLSYGEDFKRILPYWSMVAILDNGTRPFKHTFVPQTLETKFEIPLHMQSARGLRGEIF